MIISGTTPAAILWFQDICLLPNRDTALYACMCTKLLQLCPALCDPMDCRSSVYRILQARILEWVVMPSSNPGLYTKTQFQNLAATLGKEVFLFHRVC